MNPTNNLVYTVPDKYAGKTYRQIQNDPNQQIAGVGQAKFDPNQLGIGLDQALTAGQQINYKTDDPTYRGGGLYQSLNTLFGNPMSQEQAAVQPAVNSLQESKAPMQQRYTDLLAQIKGEQGVAENRQTVSTANELARRGITGGGVYDQQFTNALNPITQQYTGLYKNTADQQNVDLNQIDQAIAQLQSGAGQSTIQNAMQQLQLQQQQNQFNQNFGLQQQQFDFQKQFGGNVSGLSNLWNQYFG